MSNSSVAGTKVPKRRFPEFRDAPPWDESRLGDSARFFSGGTPSKEVPEYWGGNIPWISATSMHDLSITKSDQNLTELAVKAGARIAKKGTLLILVRGSMLHRRIPMGIAMTDVAFNQDVKALALPNDLNAAFLLYHLLASESIILNVVGNTGIGAGKIDTNDLKEFVIRLPRLREQRTIADCFSSIDEIIGVRDQELVALKSHKNGLLRYLFPAEGETVPTLRFPEFRDTGEWKKQKVSRLLKRVSNAVSVDLDQIYPQIGIRSHGKGIFHKEPVNGKALGNKRVFWVEENAFVVNIVFAWEQAVAKTSSAERGMIASHRFPMYKAIPHRSNINYILYFFLTKAGKDLLWLASPGGAGRNKTLGQKEFENLEFFLPEQVEEQTKIADFLSSIDELITAKTLKIEALKAHKKGLMQQLFPSADEARR